MWTFKRTGGISVTFRRRLVEISLSLSLTLDSINAALSAKRREERGKVRQATSAHCHATVSRPAIFVSPGCQLQFSYHSKFSKVVVPIY